MKNVFINVLGSIVLLLLFSVQFNAQSQNKNITPYNKHTNDAFTKLRSLIHQNFDYTNPNIGSGNYKTIIEFELAKDGRLTNIDAKGNCKYVSEELKNTVSQFLYKIDISNWSEIEKSTRYKMPVQVLIAAQ